MFDKSTRSKQVCQLLLSLIVAQTLHWYWRGQVSNLGKPEFSWIFFFTVA